MTYSRTRTARSADVPDTPVAGDAIGPAVFMAPGAAPRGRSADWAVTELYSLHYRALVRLAVLLVRDIPTAEDVVQDSFVAVHDGWQRLRDAESALAYLRHTVLNRSRSVLRRRAVAGRHLPNPPPDIASAEYGALVRLERSAVVQALRKLPGRQREAIVLRYYADLREAEVAAARASAAARSKATPRGPWPRCARTWSNRTGPGNPDATRRRPGSRSPTSRPGGTRAAAGPSSSSSSSPARRRGLSRPAAPGPSIRAPRPRRSRQVRSYRRTDPPATRRPGAICLDRGTAGRTARHPRPPPPGRRLPAPLRIPHTRSYARNQPTSRPELCEFTLVYPRS